MRLRYTLVPAVTLFGCMAPLPQRGPAGGADTNPAPALERWYGLYRGDQKVGWMRTDSRAGAFIEMGTELRIAVSELGQVAKTRVSERRTYRAADGHLVALAYERHTPAGSMRVIGTTQGEELRLSIDTGETTRVLNLLTLDRLDDEQVLLELGRDASIGARRKADRLDPATQKQVELRYEVTTTDERMLGGLVIRTLGVRVTHPSLGRVDTLRIDGDGAVLERTLENGLVARIEPPELAKNIEQSVDLLANARLECGAPLEDPTGRPRVELIVRGLPSLPPEGDRQQVERQADRIKIVVQRDAEVTAPLPLQTAAEDAEYLAATPMLQSDDPELRSIASAAAADAGDAAAAIAKLSAHVRERLHPVFDPHWQSALTALKSGRGDASEHAVLFAALARAIGIPARPVQGLAYWEEGQAFTWHAWAEVRVGGHWLAVDPTWDQTPADATHIKLAEGGPAEQARLLSGLDRISLEQPIL